MSSLRLPDEPFTDALLNKSSAQYAALRDKILEVIAILYIAQNLARSEDKVLMNY